MYSQNHDLVGKIGALVLAAGILLSGCSKSAKESTAGKEKRPSQTANAADPDVGNSGSDPTSAKSKGSTYRIDAKLWSCDVPNSLKCLREESIDEDKRSYFEFYGDLQHVDYNYVKLSIVTEDIHAFSDEYKYYISLKDYADGTLPVTTIGGYDFVNFEDMHFGSEIDLEQTTFLYRDEKSSMTISITVNGYPVGAPFESKEFFSNIEFHLPDLGLKDPDFAFESGEHQTTVQQMRIGEYTITPFQARFSEHVYKEAGGGFVTFSSTATHAASSDKYLYTYDIRSCLVYVYQITDAEMKLIKTISFGQNAVTEELLDGDAVTLYPDPEAPDKFFMVEGSGGKQKILSCLNDLAVSPDGSLILSYVVYLDSIRRLHFDPKTKTVTSERFSLEIPNVSGESKSEVQSLFLTEKYIFARVVEYTDTSAVVAYQLDPEGKLIRKLPSAGDDSRAIGAVFDLGGDMLAVDNAPDDMLTIMDESGNVIGSVTLEALLGFHYEEGDGFFTHFSLLKRNDQGDYLMIYAFDNNGLLEDLVFTIHIEK